MIVSLDPDILFDLFVTPTSDGSCRHGLESAHLGLVDGGLCELVEVVVAVVGERDAEQGTVQATMDFFDKAE